MNSRGTYWTLVLALVMALAVPRAFQAAGVIINEIHDDPLDTTEFVEFVELYNADTNPVSLDGWRFSGGISYAFPSNTTLGSGQYIVVGQDPVAIAGKFGVAALGPFSGTLDNEGESIRLRNAAGDPQDEVTYSLGFPWPTLGDAPDRSMQLLNPALDNDLGGSWRSASPTPASPNAVLVSSNSIPPLIRQVNHTPRAPASTNDVIITAKVTDADGVSAVTLQYQRVLPGSYVRRSDAMYPSDWTALGMNDNGTDGDILAGDDIYTATMPHSLHTHRMLVRYRITVEDALANSLAVPYADDPQSNFVYFVCDGIPAWTGADQPGSTPPPSRSPPPPWIHCRPIT